MTEITLNGRKIPLLYTVWEMKMLQDEIGPIAEVIPKLLGRNPEDANDMSRYASAEHLDTMGKVIMILGNAGLEEAGEEADLKKKQILRAMKPGMIAGAINACIDAMNEGMRSEIPEKKQEGPVDVTLEEIKKKETKEE